jgi:methenyltetrahydromethanopterin cyclohydrolase
MESLNRLAIERVDEAIDFAEEFAIGVHELDGGTTVLDFGLDFPGGIEAGLLLTEIQTAGLATLDSRLEEVAGPPIPRIDLETDHPDLALLGSQKAGWELSVRGFEGLGSGPARALVAEEGVYDTTGYADAFDLTVLAIETDQLPGEPVARRVAERAGVDEEALYLAVVPTASVAGGVSVAARSAELAVFRLAELGYDPTQIVAASGSAPLAPVAGDEQTAIARTNDGLVYGGRVHLVVEDDPDDVDAVASTAHEKYGRPLGTVFDEIGWDFEALPREVFAPAQVTVDVVGGPTHVVGDVHESVVAESFGL